MERLQQCLTHSRCWTRFPFFSNTNSTLKPISNSVYFFFFPPFGSAGSSLLCRLFSGGSERGLLCSCFSLWWLLLLWLQASRAQAEYLRCTGLVAMKHVASSPIRDGTRVSCIGRWILYHWATREAPNPVLDSNVRAVLSHLNHVWLFATLWIVACQASLSMGLSRQEYWRGCHALLRGIFLTQGSNPRF